MLYQFKKSLFNNVYWHLENAFDNLLIRFIWLYGGSSASKSYSVCQLILRKMLQFENENTMVMRKYAVDIKDSIYSDFKAIIELWGLQDDFICQQNYIQCKYTQSYIRFRGLDDSEKIKGLSNFKRIVLEEVSQFDEVDFKQIKKRLRGKDGQQIIGIFNPISEDSWIKTNVFDCEVLTEVESDITSIHINENKDTIILKTNYTDNIFIVGKHDTDGNLIAGRKDIHVINDFEKDKITDNNYYQIYGLGNWGKIRTGGEFWKDFNTNLHTQDVQWNEDLPIHLTFDENVNPYITCLVWQIVDKNTAIQIDEICLPDPKNRIEYVCNQFSKQYPKDRVKGLFIYGDRTSVKEDTKMQKGENFFTKILEYLQEYKPSLRLPTSNPSVVLSGGFVNYCYKNSYPIKIIIGKSCKKSINDYSYALEDSDGTIKKTKKRNAITGVSYEEYGHQSDAKRYFITMAFMESYNQYLNGGKSSVRKMGQRSISNY
jgi:PBSX family phage terminase large subunit